MAKKSMTYDEAKESLGNLKSELKEAREVFKAFLNTNGLKKTEDHSNHKDKKIAAKYGKLKGAIETLENKKEELMDFIRENKPAKSRESKYEFPDEVKTPLEKKKFRAKLRSRAKQAGVTVDEYLSNQAKYDALLAAKPKKEKAEKKEKKSKKEAAEEKPTKKLPKPVKKIKPVEKKKAGVEEEDED